MIDAVYPLEAVGRERHGTARRYRFADGNGEMGFISPVTEPFCGDCNRIRLTAEGELRTCLFSMTETDLREPLRVGRDRRGARGDHPRRRLAQGAQAPRERPRVRAAGADDVADRRMSDDRPRRCELVLDGLPPLGAERVPLADAARARRRRGRRAAPSTCRRSTARRWTATPCARPTPRPGVPLRLAGGVAAGEVAPAALEPGTAARDLDRRGAPAGRRRDPAVRAGRGARRRASRPSARSRPGTHVRYRGEDVRRGRRARAGRRPAHAAAHLRARLRRRRRGGRAPPPAAAPDRHRQRAAAARRAARAGPDPRVQRADGARCWPARAGATVVDHGVVGRRPRGDRWPPSTAGLAGDVLVVSGGVSVGPHDHVKPAFEALRRRGGVLARADQARQADVVRPPRRHARLRAAGQPAVDDRLLLRLHRAGAAAPAGRARRPARATSRAGSPRRPAPSDGRTDVPDRRAARAAPTACSRRRRPSARART